MLTMTISTLGPFTVLVNVSILSLEKPGNNSSTNALPLGECGTPRWVARLKILLQTRSAGDKLRFVVCCGLGE
jgi:hypothetical protein